MSDIRPLPESELSPESHQWWVDTTTRLQEQLRNAQCAYEAEVPVGIKACVNFARAIDRYYRNLLDAWKKHCPGELLEGQRVPNAVQEAADYVARHEKEQP